MTPGAFAFLTLTHALVGPERYVPEFMNTPDKLIGFVKRRRHVGIAYKKMHGTAEG